MSAFQANRQAVVMLALIFVPVLSCSSSEDSGANSATAKFCADFNAVSCQRTFECTPEAERKEPFFVALFGNSAGECASRWAELCRKPRSDIQADVTCLDGWTVNEAKAAMCLDRVRTATCAETEDPATRAPCEQVCTPGGGGSGGSGSSAGSGGSGGSGGSAGGGGTGGNSGPATDAEKVKFCRDTIQALCARIFVCYPASQRETPDFKEAFGANVAECTTRLSTDCTTATVAMCNLNRTQAQTCITQIGSVSCANLMSGDPQLPQSCDDACQ